MSLNISNIDTAIIAIYVLATVVFGLYLGRNANDLSSFLVGGRNLPWYAVLGSIIATETSAVTFLSIPGITYSEGGNFSFLQLVLGFIVGRVVVALVLLPSYFEGKIFTAYDVLRQRFGTRIQRTASLVFMITRTIGDGLRLYLTAIVLAKVSGIEINFCIIFIGMVTIVYASFGGIRSVVWNDCIQLVVYLVGAVATLFVIANIVPGGFKEIISAGENSQKFAWLTTTFSIRSANIWAGLLGGCFISLATHGTDQMMVQRYLCSRTERGARWAVILSGPIVLAQFALFLLVGVGLWTFAHYQSGPVMHAKDEALASFVVQHMPIGLCGLTLAAVFSVAMSTLSSSLSSSASAIVNDFLKPRVERRFSDQTESETLIDRALTRSSRLWTAIFGGLQIAVGVVVASTPSLESPSVINQVIGIAGLTAGLILGVFLLGLFKRRFSEQSALIGMVSGFCITSLVMIVPEASVWKIHSWWAAVIATSMTILVTWLVDSVRTQDET